ncbi:MAG TPA: polysaccharide biosynthesis tyrosine autokinase [Actinomycetaceae bacterium]|nr:polysaccharide biosynthesis tyrosine autokinase [Actinomycetaceae bacterium]
MELTDYLYVLRKFWMSILAVTLVGVGLGAGLSLAATPTYTSSTRLYFAVRSADSIGEAAQGSTYTERQVNSFAEVAQSPVVLEPVIGELGLETTPAGLAERVTVTVPSSTSIIGISVSDTDPERAAAIAAGVAKNLVDAVDEISPRDEVGEPVVEATVITPAVAPTSATTPNVTRNLALGLILGAMLGFGQALLRHVLDRRIRNAGDVESVTDIAVIGTVSQDVDTSAHPLAMIEDPQSARAEDYRRLRTALRFLGVDGESRVFAISSSVSGEGKTTTTLNLGLALAASGVRVLIIDADLRRPTIAKKLNLENSVGLTTVLIGQAFLGEVIQPVRRDMDVLASGKVPPNPSELLGSKAMREVLRQAREEYDYVLLDSAPLVSVTDTATLASATDGVLLVAGAGEVEEDQLAAAIDAVEVANSNVAGIVLNKVTAQDAAYRSQYYNTRAEGDRSADDAPAAPARGRRETPPSVGSPARVETTALAETPALQRAAPGLEEYKRKARTAAAADSAR